MYESTSEKTCTQCGHTFRGGTNQTCNPCRTSDRECVTCGKAFRGRERECYQCKAGGRQCKICGKTFRGTKRTCEQCRSIDRACGKCGRTFRGTKNACPSCAPSQRKCTKCSRPFRGTSTICPQCTATDRECAACGRTFLGYKAICRSCRIITRRCASCGNTFRGDQVECATCRSRERPCITCGQSFRTAGYLECGTCSGRTDAGNHRRRALRIAAEVAGPLPGRVYAAVAASGPCVYCGEAATTVDHVRPLARDGHEAEYNLVAACARCNKSKGAKLLTEWDPVRVAYAVARSKAVATEMERLALLAHTAESRVVLPDSARSVPRGLEIHPVADRAVN